MEPLMIAVLAVLAIVAAQTLAPRVRVAAPLLLVLIGIGVSLLPFVPPVEVEPELILAVVLPPLLYSSAVGVPTMDFRRDLRTISAFSVLLVLISAGAIGVLMHLLIPDIPLATGIALGAIVSPTDAVATSVVRRAGVARRITTVLEGESLLNDATALVLLRSAIAATAGTFALWNAALDFVWAILGAVAIGFVVGKLHLIVRRRLPQAQIGVTLSFVVPFLASIPAEQLQASGLVAAVTAGLVFGYGAPKKLAPEDRMTDRIVWRSGELVLESGIFLLMGLQLFGLLVEVEEAHDSALHGLWLGALTLLAVLTVRSAFVAVSLKLLQQRAKAEDQRVSALDSFQERLDANTARFEETPPQWERRASRAQLFIDRRRADLQYLAMQSLGPREGVLLVWAGMRGAITVAAAQSLPAETTHRSLLVLVAFVVAAGSLLLQGITLTPLARRLGLISSADHLSGKRIRLHQEMITAVDEYLNDPDLRQPDGSDYSDAVLTGARRRVEKTLADERDDEERLAHRSESRALRLGLIEVQRERLLELRDIGSYPSDMLDATLNQLDAEQIGMELREQ